MKSKTYEVDGKRMTFEEIRAECPLVSRKLLWGRLNLTKWHRLEDLRVKPIDRGMRKKKEDRLNKPSYGATKSQKLVKRNPKWTINEIASMYGIARHVVRDSMKKSGVSAVAIGRKGTLHFDSVEVSAYMRSIGKVPK